MSDGANYQILKIKFKESEFKKLLKTLKNAVKNKRGSVLFSFRSFSKRCEEYFPGDPISSLFSVIGA